MAIGHKIESPRFWDIVTLWTRQRLERETLGALGAGTRQIDSQGRVHISLGFHSLVNLVRGEVACVLVSRRRCQCRRVTIGLDLSVHVPLP